MESAKAQIRLKYVAITKVVQVRERFENSWISGAGPDALFEAKSLGWWVQFEGSQESINFITKPEFAVGDQVKITFERIL